jgi:hypothetical protein
MLEVLGSPGDCSPQVEPGLPVGPDPLVDEWLVSVMVTCKEATRRGSSGDGSSDARVT